MSESKVVIETAFRFDRKPYPAGKKAVLIPSEAAEFAVAAGLARVAGDTGATANKATKAAKTKGAKE